MTSFNDGIEAAAEYVDSDYPVLADHIRALKRPEGEASTINNGGPAFPFAVPGGFHFAEAGMTLRDWFAGMAVQGLLAHASGEDPLEAPKKAYELADAMLAEREKGK